MDNKVKQETKEAMAETLEVEKEKTPIVLISQVSLSKLLSKIIRWGFILRKIDYANHTEREN